jgi:aminoglycoside/choline kinase family phosphotransferase
MLLEESRESPRVSALLRGAGLNAPEILAQDLDRGFLLLSDLGRQTYLDVINNDNADELMRPAIGALVRWQAASRDGELPPYDEALLRREMALFGEWYCRRHAGLVLAGHWAAALQDIEALLVASALAQSRVFVHRDWMPRNLMLSDPTPGILDFQDAVCGPICYDAISLFRDAFVSWDEAREIDWLARYWEQAKRAGLPVDPDFAEFYRAAEWMGLQRHLKVLGIFSRLWYRDGKREYLADLPLTLRYVRDTAARYAELRRFSAWVEAVLVPGLETANARAQASVPA